MLLSLLLACHGAAKQNPGETAETVDPNAPTWGAEVSPIVQRSCVGCHHDGGVGSGDFTTYADAQPMAFAMAAALDASRMPPPAMDPACRAYQGHDRLVLSAEEVAMVTAWADAGAPEGDPVADLVPVSLSLEGADIEVSLPVAHAVSPGSDNNEYHCQVLENPFTESTYITGFDVLVDQPGVVHHALLAIDTSGDAGGESGESDLTDGWDCRTPIAESDWNILHAWAPGMEPTAFEDGGLRVEPGDQLVLQMHYYAEPSDAGTLDQSGYRFRTASDVAHNIGMAPLGPTDFLIPAGEQGSAEETYVNEYNIDVTVYGVFPHMHELGIGYESKLDGGADGEECLARANAWDFGHQMTYLYEEPAVWNEGETLTTRCEYDNTTDSPVRFGEATGQEMCFFLFYYGVD